MQGPLLYITGFLVHRPLNVNCEVGSCFPFCFFSISKRADLQCFIPPAHFSSSLFFSAVSTPEAILCPKICFSLAGFSPKWLIFNILLTTREHWSSCNLGKIVVWCWWVNSLYSAEFDLTLYWLNNWEDGNLCLRTLRPPLQHCNPAPVQQDIWTPDVTHNNVPHYAEEVPSTFRHCLGKDGFEHDAETF